MVGGSSCRQPPRGRAHVLQTQPTAGDLAPEQLRSGVRITFDRPVAPAKLVGSSLATPAVVIEPAISGESRWLDARTLAFFPREKLRSSSAYTITLDRALETSPDVALDSWKGLAFVHDRVEILSVDFDGDREFEPARPLITVATSQATRPADAARACAFIERRADGSEGPSIDALPARRDTPPDEKELSDTAEDGGTRSLALTPAKDLRPSSSYIFRCGRSFHPARGSVGLAKAHDEIFSTHGPAGVKKVAPSGNDVAADGVKVTIEFGTPMDPREVRAHVTLQPAGEPARPLELAADRRRTIFTWSGDLEPDVRYEVRIAPGLKDVFGQVVAEEARHAWTVGDASPRLRTERGIYVIERALGKYPVYTRNLPSFDVRCAAVPETRLAAVLTGPANYDSWWDAEHDTTVDYDKLGLHLHAHTITPDPARNRWHDNSLDLAGLCGGHASGVYLLEMTTQAELGNKGAAQRRDRRTLATVTDLGLLAKVGNASSLVWVVRLVDWRARARRHREDSRPPGEGAVHGTNGR